MARVLAVSGSAVAVHFTRQRGMSVCCRVRTSSGTFLNRDHDDVVRRIEERIARFSKIPFANGESLQILHYGELCV